MVSARPNRLCHSFTQLMRTFALLLLLISTSAFGFLVWNWIHFHQQTPEQKFESLWIRDLNTLKKSKSVPPAFYDLSEIKVVGGNPQVLGWLPTLHAPIDKKSQGGHRMEILLVSWTDTDSDAVIVQYDIYDNKTGNLVWELGRTLILRNADSIEERTVAAFMRAIGQ